MRQHQAGENEGPGKPPDDQLHFHKGRFGLFRELVKTARHQCPDDHAVKGADKRIARQRASPGRTPDELVIAKAQASTDDNADNDV
jgi:hypothetical protein